MSIGHFEHAEDSSPRFRLEELLIKLNAETINPQELAEFNFLLEELDYFVVDVEGRKELVYYGQAVKFIGNIFMPDPDDEL